jgi:hypothetical protein
MLWVQESLLPSDFLTSIKISHRDENNELNVSEGLTAKGYERIGNSRINLELWVLSDPYKSKGYSTLAVSDC